MSKRRGEKLRHAREYAQDMGHQPTRYVKSGSECYSSTCATCGASGEVNLRMFDGCPLPAFGSLFDSVCVPEGASV